MIARSLSLFVAVLALAGVTSRVVGARFDPTLLWIDLRTLPHWIALPMLIASAASLGAFAAGYRSRWLAIAPAMLATVAMANVAHYYVLISRDVIRPLVPLPFTLLSSAVLLALAVCCTRRTDARPITVRRSFGFASAFATYFVAFALIQMWLFGKTDYTRPADAIVVLGARAYADGRPSDALADRVRTAAVLYHEGRAPLLIMSGGPGDGAIDEPQAMRNYAISLGVPAHAIRLDPGGTNTAATIDYLAANHTNERLLAVSHFYHLPRVKFAAEQRGLRLTTSPARERYTLSQLPSYVGREVAAFWVYLVRGTWASALSPAHWQL